MSLINVIKKNNKVIIVNSAEHFLHKFIIFPIYFILFLSFPFLVYNTYFNSNGSSLISQNVNNSNYYPAIDPNINLDNYPNLKPYKNITVSREDVYIDTGRGFNLKNKFYLISYFLFFILFPFLVKIEFDGLRNSKFIFDYEKRMLYVNNLKIPFDEIKYFSLKKLFIGKYVILIVDKNGKENEIDIDLIYPKVSNYFTMKEYLNEIKELGFKVKYLNNS
jgi:hypothetical protein